jgi:hypothetical protein
LLLWRIGDSITIREIKRLIGIIAILAILAIIIMIFTTLWPAFVTTTTEYAYNHETADQVNITVLCMTPHNCSVFVNNSTGNRINVTIQTTVPISAEYKGSQKVYEAFMRNVTFVGNSTDLYLNILLTRGDDMFMFSPSNAIVYVSLPAGTNYTLVKKWPYYNT